MYDTKTATRQIENMIAAFKETGNKDEADQAAQYIVDVYDAGFHTLAKRLSLSLESAVRRAASQPVAL